MDFVYHYDMSNAENARLRAMFEKLGIKWDAPGFYDDERFVEVEAAGYDLLPAYGRFVESQSYDDAYLARCREEVPVIAKLVWEELVRDGRLGACIDIGMILLRCLEQEG